MVSSAGPAAPSPEWYPCTKQGRQVSTMQTRRQSAARLQDTVAPGLSREMCRDYALGLWPCLLGHQRSGPSGNMGLSPALSSSLALCPSAHLHPKDSSLPPKSPCLIGKGVAYIGSSGSSGCSKHGQLLGKWQPHPGWGVKVGRVRGPARKVSCLQVHSLVALDAGLAPNPHKTFCPNPPSPPSWTFLGELGLDDRAQELKAVKWGTP